MSPRPRKRGNKDLPTNLYEKKVNGKIYFQYKHPLTGKFIGLGTDKRAAKAAAVQANQELMKLGRGLMSKITHPCNLFKDYLDDYINHIVPRRRIKGEPLSPVTIKAQSLVIKTIAAELGHIEFSAVTQRDISEYLDQRSTSEVYNKHRQLLCMVYRHAVSDGLVGENLPEKIIKRDADRTKRDRLTLDQYRAVYKCASQSIKNAMELSLNSIQRRADIQSWRFDCEKEGYYHIIQSKTRKHGKAAYLRIPIDLPVAHSQRGAKTLREIVNNCRDEYLCPYLVHEQRQRRYQSKSKEHSMQLSVKQISDGFTEARKKTGLFNNTQHPPTFHELISLGQHLREKQGWSLQNIKTLRGHTSEQMTRKYMDRDQWTTFEIGA